MIARKIVAVFGCAALALTITACSGRSTGSATSSAASGEKIKVGIAMPQKTSQNWVEAEGFFKEDCAKANLDCDLQFANGGVSEQQNQIDAMITKGVKVLVIGAIDGSQLGTQLQNAKKAGIKVISYDRLLTNTKDQDFYIAYDNYHVGELQAKALLEGLKAKKPEGTATIEVFAGSPDDANSLKFFNGAMDTLKPEIEAGKIKIGSGQKEFQQASTQGWDPKNAQTRMDALLTSTYSGNTAPDGVLSPNDTLARAIITSCTQANKPIPVVTGQDSEDESVKWVVQGKQYSTIYKDTRALVSKAVQLSRQVAEGKEPSLGDGVRVDDKSYEAMQGAPVKAFLLAPQIVTKDNAAEVYKNDPTRKKLVEEAKK